MFDLIIVGGGPAGVSAGVYAARKQLKTLLITESFGGQSVDSMGIENWIGTKHVSGLDFAKMLEEHLRAHEGEHLEIRKGEKVEEIIKLGDGKFSIKTGGGSFDTKTVLIATGSRRRKLEIPGAKEFENKGITYCASCDGPLFSGQDVAVIGGGNAGFESAAQLLNYAKSVTLITQGSFIADKITVDKVLSHPLMRGVQDANPLEVKGDKFVTSLVYEVGGERKEIAVGGIFVEIGLLPTTEFLKSVVELNKIGQIVADPRNQRTSTEGIWAAGDSTDGLFHQNNIASGDAVKALEDIYLYLHTR